MTPDPLAAGARRAAIVLLAVGDKVAEQVLRGFGEEEVRRVAESARKLADAAPEEVVAALEEFVQEMEGDGIDARAGDRYLREVAARALGDEAARRAFEAQRGDPLLAALADADPEVLARALQKELPQTRAFMLAALPAERAGRALSKLGDDARADAVRRIASMTSLQPEVAREVGEAVLREVKAQAGAEGRRVDGPASAAAILKKVPKAQSRAALEAMAKEAAPLAEEVKKRMFVFDDLLGLDDRALQSVLKEVDGQALTVALKSAAEALQAKFFRNVSSRAAEMLKEDLAALGPVRVADAEKAQGEILQVAQRLADEGRILLPGGEE